LTTLFGKIDKISKKIKIKKFKKSINILKTKVTRGGLEPPTRGLRDF